RAASRASVVAASASSASKVIATCMRPRPSWTSAAASGAAVRKRSRSRSVAAWVGGAPARGNSCGPRHEGLAADGGQDFVSGPSCCDHTVGKAFATEEVQVTVETPTITVVDPATEQEIGSYPEHGPEQIEAALAAADTAFRSWRRLDVSERGAVLTAVAGELR